MDTIFSEGYIYLIAHVERIINNSNNHYNTTTDIKSTSRNEKTNESEENVWKL